MSILIVGTGTKNSRGIPSRYFDVNRSILAGLNLQVLLKISKDRPKYSLGFTKPEPISRRDCIPIFVKSQDLEHHLDRKWSGNSDY